MGWSIAALYAQNKPSLRGELEAHPILGPALHRLRADRRLGPAGERPPWPAEGMLAVPGFGPPDHDRIGVDVPWDALIGPPLRITFPADAALLGAAFPASSRPPAPTLRALKDLSLRSRSPVILYLCEMWGGDIDLEVAWVPGWVSGEPDRVLWHTGEGPLQAIAAARPRPLGRDVLGAALEYLRVRMPSPYFLPHTRGFPWERFRVHPRAGVGDDAPPRELPAARAASLYRRVEEGDLEGAARLLEAGADPRAYHHTTPLEVAAGRGDAAMLRLLLAHGADPAPPVHLTALHAAADVACAELLLSAGVPVDGDPRFYGPLVAAASAGRDAVARLLVDRGASVEPAEHPRSVWFAACEGGLGWLAEALLARGVPVDERRHDDGPTGLEVAAGAGRADLAALLTQRGAALDARTMVAACEGGLDGLVRLHLDRGVAVGASRFGQDGLTAAIRGGHGEVVRVLLDAGADPDAIWIHRTMLHLAAESGSPAVVELLLDRSRDPAAALEARDHLGWTPLFHAAWNGDAAVAALLLRRGAAIDVTESGGRRLVDVAQKKGLDLEALQPAPAGVD